MIVVSQGPIQYYDRVEDSWDIPIIHSGWFGEQEFTNSVHSIRPPINGVQNLYLQRETTIAGLLKALDKGHKYAIKIRSDMIPTNSEEFLKVLTGGIDFLFYHDYMGGYLVDYLQAGPIKDLIELWSFEDDYYQYPEEALTKQAKKLNMKVNFIGQSLTENNDIFWIKNDKYLSSYKTDKLFLNYER